VSDASWQACDDELRRWSDAGRVADFWWRDDDATSPTPALVRLVALAAEARVPLGLATIPDGAEAALFDRVDADGKSFVEVLQHGNDHRNRAAAGDKASEFPASEPSESLLARLASGRARLQSLAGDRLLPVLVPPWNRFPATIVPALPALGIRGCSTFGPRESAHPARGIRQANTHVDLIAWKRGRGFVGEERALAEAVEHLEARRTGRVDRSEPTGWLTHHAVHAEELWSFLGRLFERTRLHPAARWLRPSEVFRLGKGSSPEP
jgi:hypothetical protein